jgi:hypothetical protein
VLLVVHDVPAAVPLDAVCPNRQPFAAGLILAATPAAADWLAVRIRLVPHTGGWPGLSGQWLPGLAHENSSALGVALLAAMASGAGWPVTLPLSPTVGVQIARREGGAAAGAGEPRAGVSS